MRLAESLNHLIKRLVSFDIELKGFQPKGPADGPSVSAINFSSKSSESIREMYYKDALRNSGVLPWPKNRK